MAHLVELWTTYQVAGDLEGTRSPLTVRYHIVLLTTRLQDAKLSTLPVSLSVTSTHIQNSRPEST